MIRCCAAHPFGAPAEPASAPMLRIGCRTEGFSSSLHTPANAKGPSGAFCISGGEGGIRTLGTLLTYTHFPGVLLQPLGHLSSNLLFVPKSQLNHPWRRNQLGHPRPRVRALKSHVKWLFITQGDRRLPTRTPLRTRGGAKIYQNHFWRNLFKQHLFRSGITVRIYHRPLLSRILLRRNLKQSVPCHGKNQEKDEK